ncbi:MAG: hypothetical protein NTV66_01700 [Methylococcales bacterium]|nr:hypothetical protein [Methylococcales bacterium]
MTKMIFSKVNFRHIKNSVLEYGTGSYAALSLALAYLIILISSIFPSYKSEQLAEPIFEVEQPALEKSEKNKMDFLLIKDWHLFGNPSVSNEQKGVLNDEPQETQLQIKLLGVFFLPNQKKTSYAIIESEDKIQKKYRLGDELPGSITLQSITKEQVILLRNQQPESLSMDRKKTGLLFITK